MKCDIFIDMDSKVVEICTGDDRMMRHMKFVFAIFRESALKVVQFVLLEKFSLNFKFTFSHDATHNRPHK